MVSNATGWRYRTAAPELQHDWTTRVDFWKRMSPSACSWWCQSDSCPLSFSDNILTHLERKVNPENILELLTIIQQHTDAKLFLRYCVTSQNHSTDFLQSQNPARHKDQIFCPFLCQQMMYSGMHSSKTAITHKANVLNNHCSPCPTPETFEKPKIAKFKDQTFTLGKKWKKIHNGNPLYFQTSPNTWLETLHREVQRMYMETNKNTSNLRCNLGKLCVFCL